MICSVIRKMIHMISRVSEHTNVTFLSNVLIKSIVMTVVTGSSFNILSPLYCKLVSISPVYSDVVSQLTSGESRHRKDTDTLGHPDLRKNARRIASFARTSCLRYHFMVTPLRHRLDCFVFSAWSLFSSGTDLQRSFSRPFFLTTTRFFRQ